jgi:hypothetical protein
VGFDRGEEALVSSSPPITHGGGEVSLGLATITIAKQPMDSSMSSFYSIFICIFFFISPIFP